MEVSTRAPPDRDGGLRTAAGDVEAARSAAAEFVAAAVRAAGADGVVVPMSGGLDSTTAAALAADALGPERVLGLGLPARKGDAVRSSEARSLAESFDVTYVETGLRPLVAAFEESVRGWLEPGECNQPDPMDRQRARGNLVARLRMACAYYAANRWNRLVLGTANRSELLLGYVTKHGDAGADLHPLGDLYKTEVRALAADLGVPDRVLGKTPTAGLWAGQTDAGELGAPYETVDPLLARVLESGESVASATEGLEVGSETARELLERCAETAHKRAAPPTPGIADRHPKDPADAGLAPDG